MKTAFLLRVLCLLGLVLASPASLAATDYTFSGTSFPICGDKHGSVPWSNSGTTYTCSASISLDNGDSISPASAITVVANAGITLAGQNTIGSASAPVNLQTVWGDLVISDAGTSSAVHGSLTVGSGSISVADAVVSGNVTAQSGSVTISNSTVGGTITTTSGAITLTSVALTDSIVSSGNVTLSGPSTVTGSITTSGSLTVAGGSVGGNVSANNGVTMTGGTVFGSSVTSTNGPVSLNGGSVQGNVSGHNGVTTTNGTVIIGDVKSSNGSISLAGGSVGSVFSDCCSLTTNNTDIKGSVSAKIGSARDTVRITGGTISGAISTSGGNGIFITNAMVTSGSITTTNVQITISNSTIGSPTSRVNVTNNGNQSIDIKGTSVVYGDVTTGGKLTIDSTASVRGNCGYSSISGQCSPYVAGPDHIQLELSGSPLTCAPSIVTVKACTSAAPGCAPLYSSAATVTLSASNGGVWNTSPITFTGSTTVSLRKTTVGSTTLGAASSGSGATTCYLNRSTNNCQIDFVDSALLLTIPMQTAGVTSSGESQMTVSAVRASNNSLDCVPAFANVTRNIKFWSSYNDPSNGSKTLAVGGTTVPMNNTTLPGTSGTGTAVALAFNASGKATPTLKYDDAGRLLLNARYDGSAANGDASLVMTGSSLLVTAPYGLCVDSPDQNTDGSPAWRCAAADLTCAKYKKAGEAFNLRVTGKAFQLDKSLCDMPTTANYQQNDIGLAPTVVAPSGGASGTLGTSSISITANGAATISTTQSEVGVFTFTATPRANAYFGAYTVAPGTSVNFGRFVPDHFAITKGDVSPACGTFSYFGQDGFTTPFTLTAQNAAGAPTANYTGSFARLVLTSWGSFGFGTSAALPAGAALASSATPPSPTPPSVGWSSGVASVTAKHQVNRPSALAGETAVTVTAQPVDSDGVTMASAGAVQSTATPLRYGRVKLSNAFGSELLGLPLDLRLQYWAGPTQGWQSNTLDTCTSITAANFAFSFPVDSKNHLAACETSITVSGVAPTYKATALTAPGKGHAGWTDVTLNLGAAASGTQCSVKGPVGPAAVSVGAPWLQFNWTGVGDADPSARATFGVYKTGPVINRREMY